MIDPHIIGLFACSWFGGWQATNMVREWWMERAEVRRVLEPFRGGYVVMAPRHLAVPILLSTDPREDTRQIPPRLKHPASCYDNGAATRAVILSGRDVWLVPGSGRRISQ